MAKTYSKNWKLISKHLPGRSAQQCSQRFRRINPKKVRKTWSPDEDARLLRLLQVYGKNWAMISHQMKNRSGKQVRERYINKLDPAINTDPFSEEEDRQIIKHYHEIGPKWSEISKWLNGRPENMVKNRFYSHIKKHYDIDKSKLKPGSRVAKGRKGGAKVKRKGAAVERVKVVGKKRKAAKKSKSKTPKTGKTSKKAKLLQQQQNQRNLLENQLKELQKEYQRLNNNVIQVKLPKVDLPQGAVAQGEGPEGQAMGEKDASGIVIGKMPQEEADAALQHPGMGLQQQAGQQSGGQGQALPSHMQGLTHHQGLQGIGQGQFSSLAQFIPQATALHFQHQNIMQQPLLQQVTNQYFTPQQAMYFGGGSLVGHGGHQGTPGGGVFGGQVGGLQQFPSLHQQQSSHSGIGGQGRGGQPGQGILNQLRVGGSAQGLHHPSKPHTSNPQLGHGQHPQPHVLAVQGSEKAFQPPPRKISTGVGEVLGKEKILPLIKQDSIETKGLRKLSLGSRRGKPNLKLLEIDTGTFKGLGDHSDGDFDELSPTDPISKAFPKEETPKMPRQVVPQGQNLQQTQPLQQPTQLTQTPSVVSNNGGGQGQQAQQQQPIMIIKQPAVIIENNYYPAHQSLQSHTQTPYHFNMSYTANVNQYGQPQGQHPQPNQGPGQQQTQHQLPQGLHHSGASKGQEGGGQMLRNPQLPGEARVDSFAMEIKEQLRASGIAPPEELALKMQVQGSTGSGMLLQKSSSMVSGGSLQSLPPHKALGGSLDMEKKH